MKRDSETRQKRRKRRNPVPCDFLRPGAGRGVPLPAYYAAYQLGLTGWVRNCWDETVEMEVQGDEETITEMIKRIRTSSYIEITDAKWTKIPLESEFGFHIR